MLVFHPPGETHRESHHDQVGSLNVEIGGTWLRRFAELGCTLDRPAEFAGGLVAEAGLRILREFREPDRDSALTVEGLTWEILAASSAYRTGENRFMPRWVAEARELLDAQLDAVPRLRSLADAVGVHPVHFAAVFRRFQGCSVGEYVRRRRIDHVRRRLRETDDALAEIATEAGFADQSHLTRTFKRFVGLTPGQYRTFLAFKKRGASSK
jgi:AraC-like DNA-binding protein